MTEARLAPRPGAWLGTAARPTRQEAAGHYQKAIIRRPLSEGHYQKAIFRRPLSEGKELRAIIRRHGQLCGSVQERGTRPTVVAVPESAQQPRSAPSGPRSGIAPAATAAGRLPAAVRRAGNWCEAARLSWPGRSAGAPGRYGGTQNAAYRARVGRLEDNGMKPTGLQPPGRLASRVQNADSPVCACA